MDDALRVPDIKVTPATQQLIAAIAIMLALVARAVPGWIDGWSKARIAKSAADTDAAVKRADAVKAEADAALTRAQADKLSAETAQHALTDFRKRLDDCETRHTLQDAEIEGLHRMRDADQLVIAKFAGELQKSEDLIRGLRSQVNELERIVQSGGVHG